MAEERLLSWPRLIAGTVGIVVGLVLFTPSTDCINDDCFMLIQKLLPFETPRWPWLPGEANGALILFPTIALTCLFVAATAAIEKRLGREGTVKQRGWQ